MGETIYFINVLGNIREISGFFTLVSGVFIALIITFTVGMKLEGEEELYRKLKNTLKKIVICFGICLSLFIFIPSRNTMYSMLIADKVLTKETHNNTVDETKKLIDYTINKIEEVKEKKE